MSQGYPFDVPTSSSSKQKGFDSSRRNPDSIVNTQRINTQMVDTRKVNTQRIETQNINTQTVDTH